MPPVPSRKRNGDIYSTRPDGAGRAWLPAYTRVDTGPSCKRHGWDLQLTVANLLDMRYWPDTGGIDRVTPGSSALRATRSKAEPQDQTRSP